MSPAKDDTAHAASRDSSAPTILLVEDQPDNQFIYHAILTHGGYHVVQAWDGAAAIDLARAHRPALILMDLSLPVMDGWEATRRLRDEPELAAVPIIALTAHALAGERARADAIGFAGYLVKPIDPRSVLAVVRDLLGAPPAETP